MRNDSDKRNLVLTDDGAASGFTRWLPTLIVFSVVGGFFTLSWYAYHAGVDSVRDEDLLVVEADKTPMKEKPADPGGMQFPNQDKTIFDTFGGSKTPNKNVERILPSPEEPMSKDIDTSETSTWVNNKLADKAKEPVKEQVIGRKKDDKPKDKDADKTNDHQVIPVSDDDGSETFVAARDTTRPDKVLDEAVKATDDKKSAKSAKEMAAQAEKEKAAKEQADKAAADKAAKEQAAAAQAEKEKTEKEKAEKEKAAAAQAEKERLLAAQKAAEERAARAEKEKAEKAEKPISTSSAGSTSVQLGAYRSQEEAADAWEKMHLKQKDLSDKQPSYIRADLGDKGIYYRLRITGLDTASAKSLCQSLNAKGQACIIPVGK